MTNDSFYVSRLACDPIRNRIVSLELASGQLVAEQVYEITERDSFTGVVIRTVPVATRTVDRLQFSPDGTHFVSQSGTSIFVWDATDLALPPRKVRGSGRRHFTDIAFTPDSRHLLATSNDRTVTVYDTASWQVSRTFTWDIGRMRSVAVSPDGLIAAAGGDQGKIVVWDLDL